MSEIKTTTTATTMTTPTTRGTLTGKLATRRKPKKIGRQTDDHRLEQLADAVAEARARPHDAEAARTAGRLAAMVALILLAESDDRRRLMLDLLSDGLADAPPSSHTTETNQ